MKEGYYKPFYFDSDLVKKELDLKLLGKQFEQYFWGNRKTLDYQEKNAEDKDFIGKFKAFLQNESIPEEFTAGSVSILDALYYLKTGKIEHLNYRFKNLKEFTNLIMKSYPVHGYIFCRAVKKFRPSFKSDELSNKLKKKVKDFWKEYKTTEAEGMPNSQDKRYNPILKIFFPELEEYLD